MTTSLAIAISIPQLVQIKKQIYYYYYLKANAACKEPSKHTDIT